MIREVSQALDLLDSKASGGGIVGKVISRRRQFVWYKSTVIRRLYSKFFCQSSGTLQSMLRQFGKSMSSVRRKGMLVTRNAAVKRKFSRWSKASRRLSSLESKPSEELVARVSSEDEV